MNVDGPPNELFLKKNSGKQDSMYLTQTETFFEKISVTTRIGTSKLLFWLKLQILKGKI